MNTSTDSCQHVKTKTGILPPHTDPAWDEIAEGLGEASADVDGVDYQALAIALRRIILFCIRPSKDKGTDLCRNVGRRMLTLAHALDPSLFNGTPSLRGLASQLSLARTSVKEDSSTARESFNLTQSSKAKRSGVSNLRRGKSIINPESAKRRANEMATAGCDGTASLLERLAGRRVEVAKAQIIPGGIPGTPSEAKL